jgi:hypothetical protein
MMTLLFTVADAPTDLLSTILCIVVGLVVAAVCWLTSTVVCHGEALAGLAASNLAQDDAHKASCKACRDEMDRRMTDGRTDTDRRFDEVKDSLKSINEKLDKILAK